MMSPRDRVGLFKRQLRRCRRKTGLGRWFLSLYLSARYHVHFNSASGRWEVNR